MWQSGVVSGSSVFFLGENFGGEPLWESGIWRDLESQHFSKKIYCWGKKSCLWNHMKHGIIVRIVSINWCRISSIFLNILSWIQFPPVTPEFFRCQELVTMLLQARCPLEVPIRESKRSETTSYVVLWRETQMAWQFRTRFRLTARRVRRPWFGLPCSNSLTARRSWSLREPIWMHRWRGLMGKLGQVLWDNRLLRPNESVKIWKSVEGRKWAESSWPCRRDLKQQGRGLCSDACAQGRAEFRPLTVWRS